MLNALFTAHVPASRRHGHHSHHNHHHHHHGHRTTGRHRTRTRTLDPGFPVIY
ncbi:hypothetical protein HNR68_004322 [Saccharopolyspora hordei]|uniref:Uncharacterized protein n=1 Tax=Saccharopolyspora hordei TaxID=1838 RepID=A0A853ALQ5_9PSEU|nr:hypothetical protein [Saccharopolyspora hordei]